MLDIFIGLAFAALATTAIVYATRRRIKKNGEYPMYPHNPEADKYKSEDWIPDYKKHIQNKWRQAPITGEPDTPYDGARSPKRYYHDEAPFYSLSAKQEAIGFNKWVGENYYLDSIGFYHHDYQNRIYYSSEELYNLYIQSKSR